MTAGGADDTRTYGQWWDTPGDRVEVEVDRVRHIGITAFEAAGADTGSAEFLVDLFVDKALQGDHARGVVLLLESIAAVGDGMVDLTAAIEVRSERSGTALVVGGPRASGDLVCRRAMEVAIEKARAGGVGVAAAQGQCRINTPYLRLAVDAGMVALMLVQSVPTVAPLGGRDPILGNAPVGIGIPAGNRPPFLLDMSLTQSSNKGVVTAAQHGLPVPEGVLLDRHGQPTTDSLEYLDNELTAELGRIVPRGSLVPLGNSHKGYALILAVGLLATLLADASPPWELHYSLARRGASSTVLIVIDPAAFRGDGATAAPDVVDAFLDIITSAPRRDGVDEILYPGLKSADLRERRRELGRIAIPAVDATKLAEVGRGLGLEL